MTPENDQTVKIEVVQFPKKCPYCGHAMEHMIRLSMEYLECRNFEGCTYPGRDTYTYARRYH